MYRQILLTGATGALGPALAAELARTAAEKIAILMRAAPSELEARFAQWQNAVRALLPNHEHHALNRLHPISGDISLPNLGINSEALQKETDTIIHAAADTGFASPHERQWDINVEGTRRTLHFAESCKSLQRFLLVSSVFVSGSRTGLIDESVTAAPQHFATYYQRTKWESEQVALASKLPLGIARISMVLGAHADGQVHRPGAVHSLIKWFTRGLIPMMPGLPEATGDVIATELAAQSLTRAISANWDTKTPPIWHIAAGARAPRMTDLIAFVYRHFASRPDWKKRHIPQPRLVDQEEFNHFIAQVDASGRAALAQAMRSMNRFLPDLLYPKTYETKQAEKLWNGPLPQYDWQETMTKVLRYICPSPATAQT
jgi:thioester reductase-like protein